MVNSTGPTIQRLASGFFLSGGILYKRTLDLGLLRCIDAKEASTIMAEVHFRVHDDLNHSPPSELHTMSAPWPFVAWGMYVIGPIEPATSNGHRFILVAIDYFTKWVEAVTFKSMTNKAVVDFVHSNIICQFRIPKVIITDNAANLNSHLMKEDLWSGRMKEIDREKYGLHHDLSESYTTDCILAKLLQLPNKEI
ncbi:uncharacterized protein [Nicotiana sylvestris]|uniref:uncharacterized protein n=1 Tax=Nicotiana sylvestris TaxID=4096 RepID=UPI00388CA6F7